jgi:hypothetical protein
MRAAGINPGEECRHRDRADAQAARRAWRRNAASAAGLARAVEVVGGIALRCIDHSGPMGDTPPLVVPGEEAIHADGSRRTAHDQALIAAGCWRLHKRTRNPTRGDWRDRFHDRGRLSARSKAGAALPRTLTTCARRTLCWNLGYRVGSRRSLTSHAFTDSRDLPGAKLSRGHSEHHH